MTQEHNIETLTIGRADYQVRKHARIDRMRAKAAKLAAESDAVYGRARATMSMIPLGQPILVGHHSEGRHRRDIGRIDSLMGKASQAHQEAQELASRADAAEESRAISSDDPEALDKLQAKLARIDSARAEGVKVNKIIRRAKGDMVAAASALVSAGYSLETAAKLTTGSRWDIGCPAYRLSNLAAESKRIESRIASLTARATAPAQANETIGEVTIQKRDNRVQLIFPGKPSEEIRSLLKRNGFRWSPMAGAWQRQPSDWAWRVAREIAACTTGQV